MIKYGKSAVAEASPISTRAELDQRIANRPKPTIERHLTIEGSQEREVRRQVDAFSENRIKALESRLDQAGKRLEHGFRLAQLRGRAKGDFGHSR